MFIFNFFMSSSHHSVELFTFLFSQHPVDMETHENVKRYVNLLLSAHSLKNRHQFILDCIKEKVVPNCSKHILKNSHRIFPTYAQYFLQSIANNLKLDELAKFEEARLAHASLITDKLLDSRTKSRIKRRIKTSNQTQLKSHQQKLHSLCTRSPWKNIGRKDLVLNLSNTSLNPIEEEALSLGLKFATGHPKFDLADIISANYKHTDSNLNKGFIQGIIAASTTPGHTTPSIPYRYSIALANLAKNEHLTITSADKGGGTVIMNTIDYNNKMLDLLNDTSTYLPIDLTTIQRSIVNFNQTYKKIIGRKHDEWLALIEYHPRIPKIYGLPKTHKKDVPMRPIVSSIDSAPHKIGKALAKILTPLLGKISPAHLRNSGDLLNRIKHLDLHGMSLSSLDVKSLYTNIPVHKCIDKLEHYLKNTSLDLPFPADKILKLCTLCTNLCFFEFNGQFFKQISGLPMGSPLSGVLACLFLEFLEAGPFQYLLPPNSHYFRYIDDTLLIHPDHLNLPTLVDNLNSVEPSIILPTRLSPATPALSSMF